MNITQRGLLAAHLQILAQEYFDNSLDPTWKHPTGLCYYLEYKFPYNEEIMDSYELMSELMDELKFKDKYFGGWCATEPFKQRAYMALILAEYLKEST